MQINTRDHKDRTPLDVALCHDQVFCAELIIRFGGKLESLECLKRIPSFLDSFLLLLQHRLTFPSEVETLYEYTKDPFLRSLIRQDQSPPYNPPKQIMLVAVDDVSKVQTACKAVVRYNSIAEVKFAIAKARKLQTVHRIHYVCPYDKSGQRLDLRSCYPANGDIDNILNNPVLFVEMRDIRYNFAQLGLDFGPIVLAEAHEFRPLMKESALPIERKSAPPIERKSALPIEGKSALPIERKSVLPIEGKSVPPIGKIAPSIEGKSAPTPAHKNILVVNIGPDTRKLCDMVSSGGFVVIDAQQEHILELLPTIDLILFCGPNEFDLSFMIDRLKMLMEKVYRKMDVPLFVITDKGMDTEKRLKSLGVDNLLFKPVRNDDLINAISSLLSKRKEAKREREVTIPGSWPEMKVVQDTIARMRLFRSCECE